MSCPPDPSLSSSQSSESFHGQGSVRFLTDFATEETAFEQSLAPSFGVLPLMLAHDGCRPPSGVVLTFMWVWNPVGNIGFSYDPPIVCKVESAVLHPAGNELGVARLGGREERSWCLADASVMNAHRRGVGVVATTASLGPVSTIRTSALGATVGHDFWHDDTITPVAAGHPSPGAYVPCNQQDRDRACLDDC